MNVIKSLAVLSIKRNLYHEKKRSSPPLIRIGISSCLLGEKVRFYGGHKRDAFLVETLGHHVEWVPVCPEVEVGMCTPRPSVRLVMAGGTCAADVYQFGHDIRPHRAVRLPRPQR